VLRGTQLHNPVVRTVDDQRGYLDAGQHVGSAGCWANHQLEADYPLD
jgi:hypothetical protein